MVYILEIISLADFRHLGPLCAGGRPIGQEISKIRGGNMKQNPLKSRGLWGVREWNRKKMYPSGWKHYAWVKKTLRRTFVSLWKNCFSPFGRKNNHFFLGKQKFASEFFCPWHKVSTQKEHIFLILLSIPRSNLLSCLLFVLLGQLVPNWTAKGSFHQSSESNHQSLMTFRLEEIKY